MTVSLPEPGQIVIVRQRPFVVLDVKASQLPAPAHIAAPVTNQHLIRLSSVEDEGLGEELSVIWEIEPGATCVEKSSLPKLEGFDSPYTFDAFLDAVTWGAVSSADTKALQSPFRAGVDVDDYQLDPVVRALSMPRVNLLIADDVGLGKTIETGLVAQELILRHRARTVLIVCPSSIQVQWQEEMRDKFGLEFRIVDSALLAELRRSRGIHVNPWAHFPRLITSIDFLKRERPMRLFRETLPPDGQPRYPRPYDLLIIDEAHNVAPSGRGKYATDSQRTSATRALAPYFEHKLFLTATPHNGYSESFSALLELLDDQRFARGIDLSRHRAQLDAVMVRRMKSELEKRWDGTRRFAQRIVKHLEVPYTEAERKIHHTLQAYAASRSRTAATAGQRFATEFTLKLLKKRLFSSPAAFASTLEKHAHTVGSAGAIADSQAWQRQLDEADDDFANDDEAEERRDEALETASRHAHALAAEERALLTTLREHAARTGDVPDSKARALIDWLKANLKPDGKWSDRRVIIFTEYRTTQKWLHGLFAAEGLAGDNRLLTIFGGMPLKGAPGQFQDRESIKAAFQASPASSPVRILLATDAASEGLNLQNHCWQLFHNEIPWNPNRMEQRNGRVDRHGQKNPEVHIYHFVGRGFKEQRPTDETLPGDLEGDLEFLYRAALKVETIREDLGKVGPVIAEQVEAAMLGKRRTTLDTSRAEKDSAPVRQLLKFERQIREQLKKLSDQLRETRQELRLSPEHIQNVVEVGLALAAQPSLRPAELSGVWPDPTGKRTRCPVFYLGALGGSWAHCANGLAHPHTKQIRPVVFDHALATGRDDVVLCHLNHRLVQMCMRLLRAEVWSQGLSKKLHRFTTRLVDDNALQTPAVIVHGRLLVIGGDNQRVHEELITAGGHVREGRFARMNVSDVEAALAAGTDQSAPPFVEDTLKTLWPKIETAALAALDARVQDRTKNLQKLLDERSEREVSQITAVMTELARSIEATLGDKGADQLVFDFTVDEKAQRERDLASLRHRLSQIPAEIVREAAHLRSRYRDPQPRLFPLAVTFLVPRRAAAQLVHGGVR